MEFGKKDWRTFERGLEKEWLLTNGIGGFASSTIIGANTRRYHGLLVAALNPPVARHLILSKIDESISAGGETWNLYSYQTPGHIMRGYLHQQRFLLDPLPVFIYNIGGIFIEKKVIMVFGKNTVAVVYRVINGKDAATLRLSPLVNFRDYHHNSDRAYLHFEQKPLAGGVIVKPAYFDLDIKLYCSEGVFLKAENSYFMQMVYAGEQERGLQSTEDHYIPGSFEVYLQPREEKQITFIATIEDKIEEKDGAVLIKKEEERLDLLASSLGSQDPLIQTLLKAADQFIVYRKSTDAKTIIAGYPWFTDWGRDTMIAFTGLTLSTGRFGDAREILYTFSRYVKYGLIPNMFPDAGQEPAYNSVDAALWYFEAVNKYIRYTGDENFIRKDIYPVLAEIMNAFMKGTLFKIKMDEDYLISAGDEHIQLTWMDAKVGDWVVTPRHGKAVEINALWYNALRVMAQLAEISGEDSRLYRDTAEKVISAFDKLFWNETKQCLYDVVTGDEKDGSVRPNQILAVSLSYPVLEGEKAKKVVETVEKELYTAYGLRSLSPKAPGYRGIYIGDQYSRDSAYHQGTVWTWPLGPFITAYMKVNGASPETGRKAMKFIEPFRDHLRDACIGSISEIFDGDEPVLPRGCVAQAWSVGEILRAYMEDVGPAIGSIDHIYK